MRRPFRVVAELAIAVLALPKLYHPTGVVRKCPDQLRERQIIGLDATCLLLKTTLVVDTDDSEIIVRPEDRGIKLHTATRLEPMIKQSLTVFVAVELSRHTGVPVLVSRVEDHEDRNVVADYNAKCSKQEYDAPYYQRRPPWTERPVTTVPWWYCWYTHRNGLSKSDSDS